MAGLPLVLLTEMLDFDDSYADVLWKAVDSGARERGLDLVVCVGRRLGHPDPEARTHNLIYRLALGRPIRAVVPSQPVYQQAEPDLRRAFASLVLRWPVAAVSEPLGSVPLVSFRNEQGMAALVRHLIRDHGKRRILLVTGTPGLSDTDIRRRVWAEELGAAGLPYGDEWVVTGHFNPLFRPGLSGDVARRIRERQADAVVTSSDLVAAVLLHELPGLGIRVPQDVAVTGFDDIPLAPNLDPPLTTVRQPTWEIYRRAVDQALDGGAADPPFEGTLVVRESCGCPPDPRQDDGHWHRRFRQAWDVTRALRSQVADLNLFSARIGALEGPGALGALFEEWLPRLGIGDYFLGLACDAEGVPGPLAVEADPLAPGPVLWSRCWASRPGLLPTQTPVFEAAFLAPSSWWDSVPRRTVLALPLVRGNLWYGVILLEVGTEGNLMCRAVQEQLASFLDRDHRLRAGVLSHHEERLRAEVEMEKTRTLGALLAGFAHDLATPFSLGRDSTSLLMSGVETVEAGLAAQTLSKQALSLFVSDAKALTQVLDGNWKRAIDLVDRFKRIGTEIPRDDLRTVDLVPFLDDLLKTLEPQWRRKNVDVVFQPEGPLEVQTRTGALVDVVSNLIQNALVHALVPGVRGVIWVSVEAWGDRCRLEVADNGGGVDDALREKIFEPYFTTRAGEGGTGLGLAIVRDRVQGLLSGSVVCMARSGGGARFVVDFPRILTE